MRLGDFGLALPPTALYGDVTVTHPTVPRQKGGHVIRMGSARAENMLKNSVQSPQPVPPTSTRHRRPWKVTNRQLMKIFAPTSRMPVFPRDAAGTRVYQGPEIPFDKNARPMSSTNFMPSDMYAIGYIMLRILSGCTETGNDFLLNHQLFDSPGLKADMGQAQFGEIWSKFLFKNAHSEPGPNTWLHHAVELAMALVKSDPEARLSCSQALNHPFFSFDRHGI